MNNNTNKKKVKKEIIYSNQPIFKFLKGIIRLTIQCTLLNNQFNINSSNIRQINNFKSQSPLCPMFHQNLLFISQIIRAMCHFNRIDRCFIDLNIYNI